MTEPTRRRVRIDAVGHAVLERVPPLVPGAGEAIVRVTSCGLCGSDAAMFTGRHPVIRPPLVPGHEIVGVVAAADDETVVGRRVAVLPQVGCGVCTSCRRGDPRLCTRMRLIGGQIDGGAADEVRVPRDALVEIPAAVPAELAPLVEPLAVACHAVARAPHPAGADVLVVGGGPIGLLVALVATARGGAVTLQEPVEARRRIAAHFGVTAVETAPHAEYDLALDCVGGTVSTALLGAVIAGGTLVVVGVAAPRLEFDGMLLQRQERAVIGSHMYTRGDVDDALALLADALLPTDAVSLDILFDRRPLEAAAAAFDDLAARRSPAVKILLEP